MTLEELEKLSIIELKAIVYDSMVAIENCQKTIQIVNNAINKKNNEQNQVTL